MRSYVFLAYGFLFNYAPFICTFFCCLSVVFQAEEFVVYFPPGVLGVLGICRVQLIGLLYLSTFILALVWREGQERCFVEFDCMMMACVFFYGTCCSSTLRLLVLL